MNFADTISVFSTYFLGIFIEAVPFLLLGTLTSGLIEAFVSHDDLLRFVPRHPVLAALFGGGMGFVFPVCECGVVPVARRLYRKGLPVPVGITFLLASPILNPIVIASTYAAFHERAVQIVYWRVVIALVVAVSIGILFSFQMFPGRLLRDPGIAAQDYVPLVLAPGALSITSPLVAAQPLAGTKSNGDTSVRMAFVPGLHHALTLAAEEFFEMGRYLILGSVLAASMRIIVTQNDLEGLATNPVNSVLVMQVLAFILSICSTTDAFVALGFANTFTSGSILGFLTFGPMIDIKSTLMFLGVFRKRVVVYLIVLPFLMTALIAIWINLNVRF
ncbi:MAG: permease [Chloroflexi bacterium]|nr:permease [Chloroflexota bacterium]